MGSTLPMEHNGGKQHGSELGGGRSGGSDRREQRGGRATNKGQQWGGGRTRKERGTHETAHHSKDKKVDGPTPHRIPWNGRSSSARSAGELHVLMHPPQRPGRSVGEDTITTLLGEGGRTPSGSGPVPKSKAPAPSPNSSFGSPNQIPLLDSVSTVGAQYFTVLLFRKIGDRWSRPSQTCVVQTLHRLQRLFSPAPSPYLSVPPAVGAALVTIRGRRRFPARLSVPPQPPRPALATHRRCKRRPGRDPLLQQAWEGRQRHCGASSKQTPSPSHFPTTPPLRSDARTHHPHTTRATPTE